MVYLPYALPLFRFRLPCCALIFIFAYPAVPLVKKSYLIRLGGSVVGIPGDPNPHAG